MRVMRGCLVVPLQFARLWLQGQDGRGVKVVAFALLAVVVRSGIAGSPSRACPNSASYDPVNQATPLGCSIALPFQVSGAWLAWFRNGPESPDLLAGFGIPGSDKSPRALFTTGGSGYDEIAGDERSRRSVVVLVPICHLAFPDEFSGVAVRCKQMRVVRHHKQSIAEPSDTAVHALRCVSHEALRTLPLKMPDFAARPGVQSPALVGAGYVHESLNHNGSCFGAGHVFHRENPLRRQARDVVLADFLNGTVAITTGIAVVRGPVNL